MYKIKRIFDTSVVSYLRMCPFLVSVPRMLSSTRSCELYSGRCGNLFKNFLWKCTVRIKVL